MDLIAVKQRFGIIGSSEAMDRALEIALRVAPTDLSVLVTGESGVGKEFFPQVIHAYSARKHNKYIAVNCGAIPEGTIDSELFGHEKGSFTGATESRKGYFEEADGGTIFLDEVAELPHSTQVRLLRVLQTGEFIRVGSSKTQKTNVRVVAATNINLQTAIKEGRFREDLYYRLNTVPIYVPALRERKEDIYTLFRKFASDVAIQYRMPPITLDAQARTMLENYYWRGNIRQLKNVAEQISAIEESRVITAEVQPPAVRRPFSDSIRQDGQSPVCNVTVSPVGLVALARQSSVPATGGRTTGTCSAGRLRKAQECPFARSWRYQFDTAALKMSSTSCVTNSGMSVPSTDERSFDEGYSWKAENERLKSKVGSIRFVNFTLTVIVRRFMAAMSLLVTATGCTV